MIKKHITNNKKERFEYDRINEYKEESDEKVIWSHSSKGNPY